MAGKYLNEVRNVNQDNCKTLLFRRQSSIVYTTRQLLSATNKDTLPAPHHSNVVYQFLCHCNSRCVGRTFQRFQQRLNQHIPKFILQGHTPHVHSYTSRSCKSNTSQPETSFSAIGQHFCEIRLVVANKLKTDFQFSPTDALSFIYPLLKPLTQKHPNQICANKRKSSTTSSFHSSCSFSIGHFSDQLLVSGLPFSFPEFLLYKPWHFLVLPF